MIPLAALIRKLRQLRDDPVLRRWLIKRGLRRVPKEPPFVAHRPPYLTLPLSQERPQRTDWPAFIAGAPSAPLRFALHGRTFAIEPGTADALFDCDLELETELALHRFAWLPLAEAVDPAWVGYLWQAWCRRFGGIREGWAWHPYTATERAVNIIEAAERHGLPGEDSAAVLAAHAEAILAGLEYFGDHHTGNHLANNGRGLLRLGLALAVPAWADTGARILLTEADRILAPSGMLREGSSHYHLLVTRWYLEAAGWAGAAGHQAAMGLEAVARRCLGVVPTLALPGGMPLVGDISPDCPPAFLAGLLPGGGGGWLDRLTVEHRAWVLALRDGTAIADPAPDGWLRADFGRWAGLWHAAPEGWSHMPGHGHQDIGGFELHFGRDAVFVDPGRGAYGETGEATFYRSGQVHNTLLVDGADPFAANKPYYASSFRRAVGGPPPLLKAHAAGISLVHHGFRRLRGGGAVARDWLFDGHRVTIRDGVMGSGRHRLRRQLVTALPVTRDGNAVVLQGADALYRVTADGPMDISPLTRWRAYGDGSAATLISIDCPAPLPWSGEIVVVAA